VQFAVAARKPVAATTTATVSALSILIARFVILARQYFAQLSRARPVRVSSGNVSCDRSHRSRPRRSSIRLIVSIFLFFFFFFFLPLFPFFSARRCRSTRQDAAPLRERFTFGQSSALPAIHGQVFHSV